MSLGDFKDIIIYSYSDVSYRRNFETIEKWLRRCSIEFICKNYDEIECELNGYEYKEPKNRSCNFCIDCNMKMSIDHQKSTIVCKKCGLCEYYPVYVASYNHTMQPLRWKCLYKRSDNFKVIVRQLWWKEACSR